MKRVKKSGKWIHRGSRSLPTRNGPRNYSQSMHIKRVASVNFDKTSEARSHSPADRRQPLCRARAPKTVAFSFGDADHREDSGKDRGFP